MSQDIGAVVAEEVVVDVAAVVEAVAREIDTCPDMTCVINRSRFTLSGLDNICKYHSG